MDGWKDGCDEWMDRWMSGWVDGWMDIIDGWINGVRVILMGINTATSLYIVLDTNYLLYCMI